MFQNIGMFHIPHAKTFAMESVGNAVTVLLQLKTNIIFIMLCLAGMRDKTCNLH